ncbi:MAG: hypothetical protein M1812_004413 [Candelaria pacifica]|nr:MAG: hypothetical protein M1812_004413 [Candelaria pacifica]
MFNPTGAAGGDFWGQLLRPDKTPTDLCRNLLQGLANYICNNIEPKDAKCLTPVKLAAFYRLLGGNYDPVFVDTPHPTLSSIYQSLGCRHSLGQPKDNDFARPSVPVLTRDGFVRWQIIQLLLDPADHVPFLQEAVRQFDIINPASGEVFPKVLPREAFPSEPDHEMTKWHDNACQQLRRQMEQSTKGAQSAWANGQERTTHGFPDSSQSADGADYFSSHRASNDAGASNAAHLSPNWSRQPGEAPMRGNMRGAQRGLYDRRRSYQDDLYRPKPSRFDGPLPARHPVHPWSHRRPVSSSSSSSRTSSVSSSNSDSEIEAAGVTNSGPPLRHHRSQDTSPLDPRLAFPRRPREIRRSSDQPLYASREYGPRPSSQLPHVYRIPNPASSRGRASGVGPPRGEARETTIRWDDLDRLLHVPSSAASTPTGVPGGSMGAGARVPERYVERVAGRGSERPGVRRGVSPTRCVDGRRYPSEGISWR